MKLLLDDIRTPYDVFNYTIDFEYYQNDEWIIVKNYEEFINYITESGVPELISFDHDLTYDHYLTENQSNIDYENMEIKTGFHAAKWLKNYCTINNMKLPKIKVHSQNPEGSKNIKNLFF